MLVPIGRGRLYGVAQRAALCARAGNLRRRSGEKQVKAMPHPTIEPDVGWWELQALLDQELSRLPVLYRVPVVLWGGDHDPPER